MSTPTETLRPPAPPGLITWIRENLFNTWYNGVITVLTLLLIIAAINTAVQWFINIADWRPVTEYFLLFLVGQYPQELVWRVGLSLAIVCLLFGVSWGSVGN